MSESQSKCHHFLLDLRSQLTCGREPRVNGLGGVQELARLSLGVSSAFCGRDVPPRLLRACVCRTGLIPMPLLVLVLYSPAAQGPTVHREVQPPQHDEAEHQGADPVLLESGQNSGL